MAEIGVRLTCFMQTDFGTCVQTHPQSLILISILPSSKNNGACDSEKEHSGETRTHVPRKIPWTCEGKGICLRMCGDLLYVWPKFSCLG